MEADKNRESVTSEVIRLLGEIQMRFEANGMDFNAQLNQWHKELSQDFAETGVFYPETGSMVEKCQAFTTALVNCRLKAYLGSIQNRIRTLQNGEEFTPEDAMELTSILRKLTAEEVKNPQFKPLIEQIRKNIATIRNIF